MGAGAGGGGASITLQFRGWWHTLDWLLLSSASTTTTQTSAQVATLLAVIALIWHAWVGVRDIFMDYIKPTGLRLTLHSVVALLLIGYAGWAAQILWRL